jgi:hypothetical protein
MWKRPRTSRSTDQNGIVILSDPRSQVRVTSRHIVLSLANTTDVALRRSHGIVESNYRQTSNHIDAISFFHLDFRVGQIIVIRIKVFFILCSNTIATIMQIAIAMEKV